MVQPEWPASLTEQTERKNSNELAEERTEWAEDRTIMAIERTFAGWMRTSFAAIAIGIGFRGLFGEFEPPWLAKGIATLFIALAIIFAIGAERRAARALSRLNAHAVDGIDAPRLRWVSYAVAVGAALLIVALWVLNDGSLK